MSTPVQGPGSQPPPSSSPVHNAQSPQQTAIQSTVVQNLNQPAPQPAESGWKIWNWSWFKKSPAKEETPSKENESGKGHSEPEHVDIPVPEELVQQPQSPARAPTNLSLTSEINNPPNANTAEKTGGIFEVVTGTASFLSFAAKLGAQALWGKATHKAQEIATPAAENYYATHIDATRARMKKAVKDPQYIEFSETVSRAVSEPLAAQLESMLPGFLKYKKVIKGLIDLNLARGFANLAEKLNTVPNHENQTALVSILSLLTQKVQKHVSQEKLQEVKARFREEHQNHQALIDDLFPNAKTHLELRDAIQACISDFRGQGNASDQYLLLFFPTIEKNSERGIKLKIEMDSTLRDLKGINIPDGMPDFGIVQEHNIDPAELETIKAFMVSCQKEAKRQEALEQIFSPAAIDILKTMFGENLDDVDLPLASSLLHIPGVKSYFIQSIEVLIGKYMRDAWESTEDSLDNREKWINTIQTHVPGARVENLIKTPSECLTNVLQNIIRSDPKAVGLIKDGVYALSHQEKYNPLTEEGTRERAISEMSYSDLAGWILESTQAVLRSEDPHLREAGNYLSTVIGNLSLALVANGVERGIQMDEPIPQDQLLNTLIDKLLQKLNEVRHGERIDHEVWQKIIAELPLPAILKPIMLEKTIAYAEKIQNSLQARGIYSEMIENYHAEALADVTALSGGQQLISITENITNIVIDKVFVQTLKMTEMGESYEEILDQYLPGVVLSPELKTALKNNISALRPDGKDGEAPEVIELLRKGIQGAILKSIHQAVVVNVSGGPGAAGVNFATQLLGRIRQGFNQTFENYTAEQKADLKVAMNLQRQIKTVESEIETLKKRIRDKPEGLTVEQLKILEDVLVAKKRVIRTSHLIIGLQTKQDDLFHKINRGLENRPWTINRLENVRQAFAYRKINQAELERLKVEKHFVTELSVLKTKQIELREALMHQTPHNVDQLRDDLANVDLLVEIMSTTFGLDKLKYISEALQIDKTIQQAESENGRFFDDLTAKLVHAKSLDLPYANQEVWDAGIDWMDQSLMDLDEVHDRTKDKEYLEVDLDHRLDAFKFLSNQLMTTFGIDRKEDLQVPDFLKDHVWPLIESAKEKVISKLLFEQLSPLLPAYLTREENRVVIREAAGGNNFWNTFIHVSSQEVFNQVSAYMNKASNRTEIANQISAAIPGGVGLETLIGPQILPTFTENREFLQGYIEGVILYYFVKVIHANNDQDILEVMKAKFAELPIDKESLRGKSDEEIAQLVQDNTNRMIDEVLGDVFKINSPHDLMNVPPAIQEMAYGMIKDNIYEQLSPVLIPMVERHVNLAKLESMSGSKMFGNISKALAKDLFYLLPYGFNSPREIALKVFQTLSGRVANAEEAERMMARVDEQYSNYTSVTVNNTMLLEAYEYALGTPLNAEQKETLLTQLRGTTYKDDLFNILMSPEKVATEIGKAFPSFTPEMQTEMANRLQALFHGNDSPYARVKSIGQQYVEGVLIRVFMRIAEKNPPARGQDSMLVLTDKLLEIAKDQYSNTRANRDVAQIARDLNDEILVNVVGIVSGNDIPGLPPSVQGIAFNFLKEQLANYTMHVYGNIERLHADQPKIDQALLNLRQFGVEPTSQRAYAQIVAEDISQAVVKAVPFILSDATGDLTVGTNLVSRVVETKLEEYSRGGLEIARVLLNYSKAPVIQQKMDEAIRVVGGEEEFVEEKQKAADFVSALILNPLNTVIQKAVDFEEEQGSDFTRKMLTNIFLVAADHFNAINAAKNKNVGAVTHAGFVEAMGDDVHPALPVEAVTYDASINEINARLNGILNNEQKEALRLVLVRFVKEDKDGTNVFKLTKLINEIENIIGGDEPLSDGRRKALKRKDDKGFGLKELIRQEGKTLEDQRKEYFHKPTVKALLKLVFPNGKDDIDFVPVELRTQAWEMMRKVIFPNLMQIGIETIFEPVMMTKVAIAAFKGARDVLDEDITETVNLPEDLELTNALSQLMFPILQNIEFPPLIKKQLIDPATGKMHPQVAAKMGQAVRNQITETFIKDNLEMSLRKAIERDAVTGDPLIDFFGIHRSERAAHDEVRLAELNVELKAISREVVDSGISFYIRGLYFDYKQAFDKIVKKYFGAVGLKLKHSLDMIFEFIFFKIIRAVLSFLFKPIKKWTKEKIYDYINLDRNRDAIMDLLRNVPTDQPMDAKHPIYHEDLIFKLGDVIRETIRETAAGAA